jgi:hypothetical protein
MGWAIVLDPYVAHLADGNVACQKIVNSIYNSAEHAFVLDKGQVLLDRYEQLARSNQEGWVRQLYEYLVESQPSSKVSQTTHILCMSPQIAESEYCCDSNADRIERVMVGLASGQPCTALVTLDSSSRSTCTPSRLFWTDDCYQMVRDQHKVCFKFSDSWDWLSEPYPPFPNTREGLEQFLRKYGQGAIWETEQLEFKCPNNAAGGPTKLLVEKTREAICAMANSSGGYVFFGVHDDGSIPGVALVYDGKPRGIDEISRILYRDHMEFQPDEPVDKQWPIQVAEDRFVFVFRIREKRVKNYTYKNERFVRVGTQSLRR